MDGWLRLVVIDVGRRLVHGRGRRGQGGAHLVRHVVGHDSMALVVVLGRGIRGIVEGLGLELELKRLRAVEVLVVADGGRDAVELEADAGGAWPGVCCGGVAFDLASATALAGPHYCGALARGITATADGEAGRTLEALVSVVLVDKDIV